MPRQLLLVLSLLVLVPATALANSDENITKRRPDAVTPQIMEIREERKENVQDFLSQIAENHANRLERRFGYYNTRLDNIITRFQKRLDALKAEGKDVASNQAKLDAAKAKLGEAKAKGAEAIAAFKAIDPAKFSEQKTERHAARDLAIMARKLYFETHKLLVEAVKLLKVTK